MDIMGIMSYHYKGYLVTETSKIVEEKHKMADKIEIDVRVNGVVTPLHKISEQTLLMVRENSKPKKIPVARVAAYLGAGRLILKVPENINNYKNEIVVIDLKYGCIANHWSLDRDFNRINALYDNVRTIE